MLCCRSTSGRRYRRLRSRTTTLRSSDVSAAQSIACGAPSECALYRSPSDCHRSYQASAGDTLTIGTTLTGARVYIAFAGGLIADEVLGSASTYLPAEFGGYKGRALEQGDILQLKLPGHEISNRTTPDEFRPPITGSWAVRACDGAIVLRSGPIAMTNSKLPLRMNYTCNIVPRSLRINEFRSGPGPIMVKIR